MNHLPIWGDEQEAQRQDELQRQKEVIEALERVEKFGIPHETVILLADECGVGEFYRKHHEPT